MASAAKRTVDMISFEMGNFSADENKRMYKSTPAGMSILDGPIVEVVYTIHMPHAQHATGSSQYPRFVIPLGRMCVTDSQKTEVYATQRIVLMDITSPRKALWLFWDYYSMVPDAGPYRRLPVDQAKLLDMEGRSESKLVKLADDISLWDIGGTHAGGHDLSAMRLLDWDAIQVGDGVAPREVLPPEALLDRTSTKIAAEAIKQGWGAADQSEPREQLQPDEPAAKRLKPNETTGTM